jgi:ligand-binding sensor domain-containing protein
MVQKEAYGQDPIARHFKTTEGLPSNTINSCRQDKDGYLWMASEFGVCRYDGFEFLHFGMKEGLEDNDVFGIYVDSKNRVWFSLSNGKLNYYSKGKIFNSSSDPRLRKLVTSSFFNGFIETDNGQSWWTTRSGGVFHIRPDGQIKHLKPFTHLPAQFVAPGISLGKDREVRIWCGKGIVNLSVNSEAFEYQSQQPGTQVDYFYTRPNGQITVFGQHQAWVKGPGEMELQPIPTSVFSYKENIFSLNEDSKGNLWVAGMEGVFQIQNGTFSSSKIVPFFTGHSVSGCFPDRQQNLWISSLNKGVYLVGNPNNILFRPFQELSGVPVTTLFKHQNTIWFGNDRGQIGYLENKQIQLVEQPPVILSHGRGRVKRFLSDPIIQDRIWAITENGIQVFRNKKYEMGFPTSTKSLAFLSSGDLAIGTASGAISCSKTSLEEDMASIQSLRKEGKSIEKIILPFVQSTLLKENKIITGTRVYDIQEDQTQTLWLATNTGLFSRQQGKTLLYKPDNNLESRSFQHLEILSDGSLILSSNGWGLFRIENKQTSLLTQADGLHSLYIKNMRRFGGDSLWVCTNSGLFRVVYLENRGKPEVRQWNNDNGLDIESINDLAFSGDTAFFATENGILMQPGFHNLKPELRSGLKLAGMVMQGKVLPLIPKLDIQKGKELVLSLVDFDFRWDGSPRFRYSIDQGKTWIPVPSNKIRLGPLPEGIYPVWVQHKLGGEIWSSKMQLVEIHVTIPWFQYKTVQLALIVLVIGLLALVWVRWRLVPRLTFKNELGNKLWISWQKRQLLAYDFALQHVQTKMTLDEIESGLELTSRMRVLLKKRIRIQPTHGLPMREELEQITDFLKQLPSAENFQIPFRNNLNEDVSALNKPVPALFLVHLLRISTHLFGEEPPKPGEINLSLNQIGQTLRFSIDLSPLPGRSPLGPEAWNTLLTELGEIQTWVEEWNLSKQTRLELLLPEMILGSNPRHSFQVLIYT